MWRVFLFLTMNEFRLTEAPARSDHVALLLENVLYVWGGLQYVNGEEKMLPSAEIWLYDMESGIWARREMGGEVPPSLFQTCGSYCTGKLYIFAGQDENGHTNQMYCVDLLDGRYTWKELTHVLGTPPSPRDRHSCWVYKDRLIYFGGYGYKTTRDVNTKSFTVNETSWSTNGNAFLRYYGWNNEVHMFTPDSVTWSEPQTQGPAPKPRASHASANMGNKGYICGGLETQTIDIYCLDLVTWAWTQIELLAVSIPKGRSLHTLTPTSHHRLLLFGGLSTSGQVLSDAWEFDTVTEEWKEKRHSNRDKPRLWHSAVQGKDNDVVVFGGSQEYVLVMDSVTVLRSPTESHCRDVLVFQTQPYSLSRLCEDCIGKHGSALWEQVSSLPARVQETLLKRIRYFRTCKEPQGRGGST
ncbi:kelch domain-containing protein 1-like [Trichomycterus rosablanca]|uniref:kelch domain-containing protein 1-like n=1 Tax=Trichomycterus rosablanca TaxID=2290929 RepID=UPI002F35DAEE